MAHVRVVACLSAVSASVLVVCEALGDRVSGVMRCKLCGPAMGIAARDV
jgi:hypothetical protein